MSDAERDLERFRAALRALGEQAAPRADCPAPHVLWEAVRTELPVERRREVVDHVAGCPVCAEAWRLAIELDPDPRPAAATPARSWLASVLQPHRFVPLAAAVAVAVAVALLLRGPTAPVDPSYRDAGPAAIRSLIHEDEPLPRTALRLRWSPGPEGSLYDVRVTTESLETVTAAQGLRDAELLVPESALFSLPAGSRLFWQVQVRLPDGERRDSRTFITRLQ
jgi:hypothetical protein